MIKQFLFLMIVGLMFIGCSNNKAIPLLDEQYLNTIKQERDSKDQQMQNDNFSPFKVDSLAKFEPLKYYDPTTEFIFKSKLYKNAKQDTIKITGTKGEQRITIIEGYVILNYNDKEHKLNIYKGFDRSGKSYHTIWFTDQTTGKETYPVGRYLDFKLNTAPEFIYEIDFNKAYNPYCAYSDLFTCPIPTKEDYIDFEIKAGEKNFHTDLNTELK